MCNRPEQSRSSLRPMRDRIAAGSQGTSLGSSTSRPCSENSSPAPEVPPEHILPPPVEEPPGRRSRRVYTRRDVGIRKYGVTIGCPGCLAITAGTTAQGHSDECRARIEQKMLEDTTKEGAMRLEEATKRKCARLDVEGGKPDVVMEGGSKASRSSCSIWSFLFVVGGETRALAAQGR